jgi:hypothetical protein
MLFTKPTNSEQKYRFPSSQGGVAVGVVTISGKMELFWALYSDGVEYCGSFHKLADQEWRQHFLYFLPLPHGQGSLRPTREASLRMVAGGAYRGSASSQVEAFRA